MTEHCVNNGTSRCQTKNATHLAVKYEDFSYDNTIGFTYNGKKAELMFHFVADPDIRDDKLTLFVTSMSDRPWHVLVYDNPFDNSSNHSLKLLPPAPERLRLYSIRDHEFSKCEELIVFMRFGSQNMMYVQEEIVNEELVRLWKCLESLFENPEFADMTVENGLGCEVPAHRAVIAAVSDVLDEEVSSLRLIEDEPENVATGNEQSTSTQASAESNKSLEVVAHNENNTDLNHLAAAISAFANTFNVSINENDSLIQYLKNNIQGNIKMPCDDHGHDLDEVHFIKPNPNNYRMVIRGLNSTLYIRELLRYMYAGHINDIDILWHDLRDLITTAVSYKMKDFINYLEFKLIDLIQHGTVTNLIDVAVKMGLEELKLAAIKHIRSVPFVEYAKSVEEPDIHKCILSSPIHKFRDHGLFTITVPRVSEIGKWDSDSFYFCEMPFYLSLEKENEDLGIFLCIHQKDMNIYRDNTVAANYSIHVVSNNGNEHCSQCEITGFEIFNAKNGYAGWGRTFKWPHLSDLDNGHIFNDTMTINVSIQVMNIWPREKNHGDSDDDDYFN